MSWFVLSLAAAVLWGTAPIFAKLGLAKADPFLALTIRNVSVAVILLVTGGLSARLGALGSLPPRTWLLLIAEGVFASLLGHYAYFYALKLGRVSSVVPVTAVYPAVAVLLGWILFGDQVTPGKIAGGVLVILGILLIKNF